MSQTQSTKLKSFIETQKKSSGTTRAQVIDVMKNTGFPMSRYDLHQLTGLRMSTICGAVFNLLKLGAIQAAGEKMDHESGRTVETLELARQ